MAWRSELVMQVGVPYLVSFLNKADQVNDYELLELVEFEVRDLLDYYEFPSMELPVICGSALLALEALEDGNKELQPALPVQTAKP